MMPKDNIWSILFVDDDPEVCSQVRDYFNGKVVVEPDGVLEVHTEVDFDKALVELESSHYDVVVLDVRLGSHEGEREEEAGEKTLASIKERRFLPVIFYTALPNRVKHLESPLVRIVEKTENVPRLMAVMKEIFGTKLPIVSRELARHIQDVQRNYMWTFVANNWEKLGDTPDKSALAYLLARRLAKSLDGPGIEKLAERLGDTSRLWCDEEHVHPMRYYVIPPVSPRLMSGDIFLRKTDGATEYLVLLSPSCDIAFNKVEWMLFVRCLILTGEDEYARFKENTENSGKIEALIKDRRANKQWERFKFMPGAIGIPDMIIDFQQLMVLSKEELDKSLEKEEIERIASLDSPYGEALMAQFSRYFGRVGTPDLNVHLVIEKLKKQISGD